MGGVKRARRGEGGGVPWQAIEAIEEHCTGAPSSKWDVRYHIIQACALYDNKPRYLIWNLLCSATESEGGIEPTTSMRFKLGDAKVLLQIVVESRGLSANYKYTLFCKAWLTFVFFELASFRD